MCIRDSLYHAQPQARLGDFPPMPGRRPRNLETAAEEPQPQQQRCLGPVVPPVPDDSLAALITPE
eukprot:10751931-Alexandrium_andersonii.AAC.1